MRARLIALAILAGSSGSAHADDASDCAQQANPAVAVRGCSALIQKAPKRANHYADRGNAHRLLGRLDLALEDFNQAIRLNPLLALQRHAERKAATADTPPALLSLSDSQGGTWLLRGE